MVKATRRERNKNTFERFIFLFLLRNNLKTFIGNGKNVSYTINVSWLSPPLMSSSVSALFKPKTQAVIIYQFMKDSTPSSMDCVTPGK
jgi:hypothetical protein